MKKRLEDKELDNLILNKSKKYNQIKIVGRIIQDPYIMKIPSLHTDAVKLVINTKAIYNFQVIVYALDKLFKVALNTFHISDAVVVYGMMIDIKEDNKTRIIFVATNGQTLVRHNRDKDKYDNVLDQIMSNDPRDEEEKGE